MQGKTGLRNISGNEDMSGQSQVPAFEFFLSKQRLKKQNKGNQIKTQSCCIDILKLVRLWFQSITNLKIQTQKNVIFNIVHPALLCIVQHCLRYH